MKKVIIYLRVSDENQEIRDSLAKQEEQAIKYCDFKGYNIYKIIKEVGSGRKNDREGFIELEQEIELNSFDILIFYELSRLARDTYILHKLIHSLKVNKIEFESITESFLNSDTPTSKMMLSFMASMAELESDTISKRVRNRMRHYASEGYYLFPPPRGYDLKDKVLHENEEGDMIRGIFHDFCSGNNYASLTSKYGISRHGIKSILSNVTYIGVIKFGFNGTDKATRKRVTGLKGEVFPGKHTSIIDEETFYIAQRLMEEVRSKNTRTTSTTHLLSSLMYHDCGGLLYGKINKHRNNYMNYQCKKCNKGIPGKKVEEFVINNLKEYAKSIKPLKANIKSKKKKVDSASLIKRLTSKKERVINAYMDGTVERSAYLLKISEIDREIQKLTTTEKEIDLISDKTYIDKLLKILDNFDNMQPEDKKNLLFLFIERINVEGKTKIEIVYKF